MDASRVRRYEQLLRRLDISIPVPFTVSAFVENVAQARRRPITMLDLDTRKAKMPCGLWIATETDDIILVNTHAPPLLRDHTVLHELAHILFGHKGKLEIDTDALPDIDPAMIQRALGRSSHAANRYGTKDEIDAEGLASVIPGFAAYRSPVPRANRADTSPVGVLDRFSSALQGDRNWE